MKSDTIPHKQSQVEEKCPLCVKYAEFFIRDYGSCYAVYHKNHACQCGHLHDDRKTVCEGGYKCGCTTFISEDGLPAINFKESDVAINTNYPKFKRFKNGMDLICEHNCGSLTYGNIQTMFDEDTIVCGGCGWAQTHEYEKYLDSEQYQNDLKKYKESEW